MRPRAAGIAIALVALLAVGACSGGTSAKQRYVEQATKVCDDSFHDITVALAILTPASTDQQAESFLTTQFVPLYRKRVAALRVLTAPKDDSATVASLLDDADAVLARIEADPAAYVRVDPFAELNPRWDAFGVTACGSRSDASSSVPADDGATGSGSS